MESVHSPKRRSRNRRRGSRRAPVPFLQHRTAGQTILLIMVALALIQVCYATWQARNAKVQLGVLATGLSREEVRYFVGAPRELLVNGTVRPANGAADAATADTWLYRTDAAITRVAFGGDGRVASLQCRGTRPNVDSCPRTLDIGIGTGEEQIWYRLGAPSRQTYRSNAKQIHYDDLGLTFTLEKFLVTDIALSADSPSKGYLLRVPRMLVP